MVDALSADFADRRLIIAPDWRGFGQTTLAAPCDHYVFADYLGDLDALIDHYPATTTCSPTTWAIWTR